jgi:hypothetical protein
MLKEIKISKNILDRLSVYDIIYAEIAEEGALGCAGQLMYYILRGKQLVCYRINIFEDEKIYKQAQKLLFIHSGLKEFPLFGRVKIQTDDDNLFNYYYGSFGNHVFINKEVSLETTADCFVYKADNKEYHIFSSRDGVFYVVTFAMKSSKQ